MCMESSDVQECLDFTLIYLQAKKDLRVTVKTIILNLKVLLTNSENTDNTAHLR